MKEFGDESELKAKGKVMTKGKDYVVMDGDIILSMLPNTPAGIKGLIISQSKRELQNRNNILPVSAKIGLDAMVRSFLGHL